MELFDVPYEVTNTVYEYEQDRLIAWANPGQHRRRYELSESDGRTLGTETCDFTTSPHGAQVAGSAWGRRDIEAIEETLRRLKSFVER